MTAFKFTHSLSSKEIGNRVEALVAIGLGGRINPTPSYDVIASCGTVECKSRTEGTDGNQSRIALYDRYFDGDTTHIAFAYLRPDASVERAYLISSAAIQEIYRSKRKMYRGLMRWRPSRAEIEKLPGRREITAELRCAEATLPL